MILESLIVLRKSFTNSETGKSSPEIKMQKFILSLVILLLSLPALGQGKQSTNRTAKSPEEATARYLESIRNSPPRQLAFFLQMPKGADLHNHLSGSIYAESYIKWAAEKGLCVSSRTLIASAAPCDQNAGQVPIATALTDYVLYRQIIDAWSMRYSQYSGKNGHDQFFDAFIKFSVATYDQTGHMLAEAAARAARGRVSYLELMLTPDGGKSSQIGQNIGWDGSPETTLEKLRAGGITDAVAIAIKNLNAAEAEKQKILKCGDAGADPGCSVEIRYVAQVSRGGALGPAFAQMVTGFMLASDSASHVVALNLVQGEDGSAAMENFGLHMLMLRFLKVRFPKAHLTLHAGELAPGIVPPEGLSFHIRDSVHIAGAERIGHGVDIMHETDPYTLLEDMAKRNVMVEICLSSNDLILGIRGQEHPLSVYLEYGVPVALATDDEGVARSEISREFLKAATEQGLNYHQLKTLARNSLTYAFLPGESLWSDPRKFSPVSQCADDLRGQTSDSARCREFLSRSEKARLQLKLEDQFRDFERRF
jgi:adenosine deaminase